MALTDKLTAIANAIRAKTGGTATMTLAEMPTEIASIQTGITPSGSVTLTSENTYDVTDKASAVVDFSATRANLAEAVTAKGVDTLPTSSFDTIAANIGLISGGGGLPAVISKIDGGSFSFAVNTSAQNQKISHNLGIVPKGFFVWTDDITEVSSDGNFLISAMFKLLQHYNDVGSLAEGYRNVYYMSTYKRISNLYDYPKENQISNYVTSTTIDPYRGTVVYKAGITYKWLAWA